MNEAGIAHLIPLAGSIYIPPAVVQEYKNNAQGWNPPQWVQVLALDRAHRAKAVAWSKDGSIDFGEAEATALALQIKADWLLSDDARARQFAQTLGLEVHG